MSEATYKVGVIARLFGVSERRIQQLAKDGIIPKAEKGKYELVGCVRGYIAFLQERAFGKDVMTIDAHQERARLLKAQADKTELEVKMLNRDLIPVEEANQARILEMLHDASQSRNPWVHGKTLIYESGVTAPRLRDVFKHRADWRDLIISDERGYYRLNVPLKQFQDQPTNSPVKGQNAA